MRAARSGSFYDQGVDDDENRDDCCGLFPEKRDGVGREREEWEEPCGLTWWFGSALCEKEGEGDEEEESAAEIGRGGDPVDGFGVDGVDGEEGCGCECGEGASREEPEDGEGCEDAGDREEEICRGGRELG